jgi:hypothetical protein
MIILLINILVLAIIYFLKNVEHFDIYRMDTCDTFNQPCMASPTWTYYNGYYYPLFI